MHFIELMSVARARYLGIPSETSGGSVLHELTENLRNIDHSVLSSV